MGIEDGHQRPNCCCVAKLALADHDTPDEMHFHERSALAAYGTPTQHSAAQLCSAALAALKHFNLIAIALIRNHQIALN